MALPDPRFDVEAVLARLTTAQKAALTIGLGLWRVRPIPSKGVRGLVLADGPHGLRKEAHLEDPQAHGSLPATCFPTGSALAATWDRELLHDVGAAIGAEARSAGVDVVLGPGVNIKRDPLCGRNFEYLSEDPLLSAHLGVAWIEGLQSRGVSACVKHFAANNQEHRRYSIDAVVDERALREVYLPSFEAAVRVAGVGAVMTAYNKVNGTYAGEHPWLLHHVLRGEWGFTGLVVSDWGAVHDRTASLAAGLDLQMPQDSADRVAQTVAALDQGTLTLGQLDRAARSVLEIMARTPAERDADGRSTGSGDHDALAVRAAAAGTVLLSNDGVLPLTPPPAALAVIGAFADEPRFQGSGSSRVTATRVHSLREGLQERLCEAVGTTEIRYEPGYPRHERRADPVLVARAVEAAAECGTAVVVVGLPEWAESEGVDREHLRLPEVHNELVEAVLGVCPRTIVIVVAGAPVEMPWRDRVSALLLGYLGGQAAGEAVARILVGHLDPGGRLAETLPMSLSDSPAQRMPRGPVCAEYRESIFVGYRYADAVGAEVAFPFGYGLSYATFDWGVPSLTPGGIADGDAEGKPLEISLVVTNTSSRPGSEVVQVYAAKVDGGVSRAPQVLAGWAKVHLEPGESMSCRVLLSRRAFAHWDPKAGGFALEDGLWELRVARSSRDIVHRASFATTGGVPIDTDDRTAYRVGPGELPTRADFERLMGRALSPNEAPQPGEFTVNTPFADMAGTPVGRRVREVLVRLLAAELARDGTFVADPERLLDEMCPRILLLSGVVTPQMAQALVDVLNGRWARGARRVVAGLPMVLARAAASRLRT